VPIFLVLIDMGPVAKVANLRRIPATKKGQL